MAEMKVEFLLLICYKMWLGAASPACSLDSVYMYWGWKEHENSHNYRFKLQIYNELEILLLIFNRIKL